MDLNKKDPTYKENLENQLSIYENKLMIKKIDELENKINKDKEVERLNKEYKKELDRNAENMETWRTQNLMYNKMKAKMLNCQAKIDNLLKAMKISHFEKIEETYNNLM